MIKNKSILYGISFLIIFFGFFVNHASAQICEIRLVWEINKQDYDANQSTPVKLTEGDEFTEKAQFRNCQEKDDLTARVIFGGFNTVEQVEKNEPITSDFIEIKNSRFAKAVDFSYRFTAYVSDHGGLRLIQRQSNSLLIASETLGGFCFKDSQCGSGESKNTGQDLFCNTGFNRCDECGIVPGSIEIDCLDSKKACVAGRCVDSKTKGGTGAPSAGPGPGPSSSTPGGSYNFEIQPYGPKDFTELINTIAKWIFNLSIPIAVIMIIYAGIKMLISQGNPGEFGKAMGILKYAIAGLVVIFIGKGFISLIQSIFTLGQ